MLGKRLPNIEPMLFVIFNMSQPHTGVRRHGDPQLKWNIIWFIVIFVCIYFSDMINICLTKPSVVY